MSQEKLGGLFVVLGDLCVSRLGCRQPEGNKSEDWFHRIDEGACKFLNCSRFRETHVLIFGSLQGSRGPTTREMTFAMYTALNGKLEARPYNGPNAFVAASFQLAILEFRVRMSLDFGTDSHRRAAFLGLRRTAGRCNDDQARYDLN